MSARKRSLVSISAMCCCLCLATSALGAEKVTVAVEGIEGDALENVLRALEVPAGLVYDGKVDRLLLERFESEADKKARTALEPFGYYHARVRTSVTRPEQGTYELHVRVDPGEPVRITEMTLRMHGPGVTEQNIQEAVKAFPLQKGEVLLHPRYEAAKESLLSKTHEQGYLDAFYSAHEIRIDPARTRARIMLVLETGNRYWFGDIAIEGAPQYPDLFLRRYLSFKSGDVFSQAKLGETQLNFSNSERFKNVVVTPQKEKARDFSVPVHVQLTPKPRRSLTPGIGYGTDTGARVGVGFRDLNAFHAGHEFNAQLYIAERLQGLSAGYTVPSVEDLRTFSTLRVNLQQENITVYDSRLAAAEISRNRSFGTDKLGTAYLRFQLEEYTIGLTKASSRLLMPGLRFMQDRYRNPIRPVQGFRYAVELRGTHQYIGSETAFVQTLVDGSFLVSLPWRFSFRTRAMTALSVTSDPLEDLPPSVRFFAGGDRSVRGYSYKSLGPRDQAGQVIGGKHLLAFNFDLERALFQDWGVSVFYDTGNAFNSFDQIRFAQGAGIGLHYYTRVGSINLYGARQLDVPVPGYRIHLTVGFEL